MPCYLFTYHGHGTWLPDHPRGYVHRQRGLQPTDAHMAGRYRGHMRAAPVEFDPPMQESLISAAIRAGSFLNANIHGCATKSTHIHVLASWESIREWKSMRASIRSTLSRIVNREFGKRDWFSDSPSRKQVRSHEHFDYLVLEYLPKHYISRVHEEDQAAAERRDRARPVSVLNRKRRKQRTTKN